MSRHAIAVVVLVACAFLFASLATRYDVVQDDAYISLVYAKNLVDGQGLVFNPGEYVEGYTNFLWVMLMAVPHALDLDAVTASRVLGGACGIGLLLMCWRAAAAVSTRPRDVTLLAAPALLAANGAVAFWSFSGMETALFALLVTAGATRYLRDLRIDSSVGVLFGLAALTRPEGWLFFGLTKIHQLICMLLAGRSLRDVIGQWRGPTWFAALVLPHLVFRWLYYGYPLPNTFYAKTGASLAYLQHGLRYTQKFLVDYGLWGLVLVGTLALLARKRSRTRVAYLALLVGTYMLYVTVVGGDTLSENRLYIPIVGLLAALMTEGLRVATLRLVGRRRSAACMAGLVALVMGLFVVGPDADLQHARDALRIHNDKLHELADWALAQEPAPKLMASTAIGIPRYRTPIPVLDLVGLTDETIAHDPQPLPGIHDDHILRNYNVTYALDRKPDAILFITGMRPGTPAERALFLDQRFRRDYRITYMRDRRPLYVRRGASDHAAELYPDATFVQRYEDGLRWLRHDPEQARRRLQESLDLAPGDFALPLSFIGRLHFEAERFDEAETALRQAVDIDPSLAMAWSHLALMEQMAALPAVGSARRAVELAPQSQAFRLVLGRALLADAKPRDAATQLLQAAQMEGEQTIACLYWLGVASERDGNLPAARAAWNAVLRLQPDHRRATEALERL